MIVVFFSTSIPLLEEELELLRLMREREVFLVCRECVE